MYENQKMISVEIIPGMGESGMKRSGGVNSSMIYCKNFCKCHNVPPPSTTINKKEKTINNNIYFLKSTFCSNTFET
jgi:hypothetical protein